jgi:hypothetical protein
VGLTFKKYLFGICTLFYLVASNGIPVYLHYCGGELEEVSYLTKGKSCCSDESSNDKPMDCCNNEEYILRTQLDGLQQHGARLASLTPITIEFTVLASPLFLNHAFGKPIAHIDPSPPPLQNSDLIDFTVMRI